MTNLVTAQEVADKLGLSVDSVAIAKSQFIIETETGTHLGDSALAEATYSEADLAVLRSAIIWQVAYLDENPEALKRISGVSSVSANGASISYFGGTETEDRFLSPLARAALRRLSWVSSSTVKIQSVMPSVRPRYRRQPDPWIPIV
jgi:hypothetical protein